MYSVPVISMQSVFWLMIEYKGKKVEIKKQNFQPRIYPEYLTDQSTTLGTRYIISNQQKKGSQLTYEVEI